LTAQKRGSRPIIPGFESADDQLTRLPNIMLAAIILDTVSMFTVQQMTAVQPLGLAVLNFDPGLRTVCCLSSYHY
jgi:hypothetical protein